MLKNYKIIIIFPILIISIFIIIKKNRINSLIEHTCKYEKEYYHNNKYLCLKELKKIFKKATYKQNCDYACAYPTCHKSCFNPKKGLNYINAKP